MAAPISIAPDNLSHIPEDLPVEQAAAMVEAACRKSAGAAVSMALMFLNRAHQYRELADERGRQLEQLVAGPWVPATLLGHIRPDWAMVASGTRQAGVAIAPKVDRAALLPGCQVLLNRDQSAIVELAPSIPRAGVVGRFSRRHGTQLLIRGASDEEVVLHLPHTLRDAEFANGDLVLYDRETLVVLDRVETRHEHANLLEEVQSDLRIHHLGGLEEIHDSILEEILLSLLHRDLAARHRLDPIRSLLLYGAPGVGKTSLMKCIANELAERAGVRVRVLLARPSIHRSKWYGESEERVRAMFEEVRRVARESGDYILLFFDDVDQIGSRDTLNDVDARVLPSFLHEVEALRAEERVMLVAATNKPELVDPALARAGRLGDREFRVPRPGSRDASGRILRCYLGPELPWRDDNSEAAIETALSAMYSPNGELATLARLVFRDGSSRALTPGMVVSGALLKSAAQAAKQRACRRELQGGPRGIATGDLLAGLSVEFTNITQRLKPGPALHSLLDLPPDLDVVRVEGGSPAQHREYLRPPAEAVA